MKDEKVVLSGSGTQGTSKHLGVDTEVDSLLEFFKPFIHSFTWYDFNKTSDMILIKLFFIKKVSE